MCYVCTNRLSNQYKQLFGNIRSPLVLQLSKHEAPISSILPNPRATTVETLGAKHHKENSIRPNELSPSQMISIALLRLAEVGIARPSTLPLKSTRRSNGVAKHVVNRLLLSFFIRTKELETSRMVTNPNFMVIGSGEDELVMSNTVTGLLTWTWAKVCLPFDQILAASRDTLGDM